MMIVAYDSNVSISSVKPIIKDGIWFPLSVENGYIEEDGFSFGLPVDEGFYGFVTFEKAVGVLADDTVALSNVIKTKKIKEPRLHDYVSFREITGWEDGLPERSETELDCGYHAWIDSRKTAYDKAHYLSESDFLQNTKIQLGNSFFYEKNGEYFAILSGWFYDQIVPVSFDNGHNLEFVKDVFNQYNETVKGKKDMLKKFNENIAALEKSFGWKSEV